MTRLCACAILLLLLPQISFCQTAENILDKVSEDTCDCLAEYSAPPKDQEERDFRLGLCLITAATVNKKALAESGFDTDKEADLDRLGDRLAFGIMLRCPEAFDQPTSFNERTYTGETTDGLSTLNGKLEAIREGQFNIVVLREENGHKHEFFWLEYFPGADILSDKFETVRGKNVAVTFLRKEFYLPKEKGYYGVKVIRDLKIRSGKAL
ncbi:hypothetical protein FUAX_15040 [Fulvitalea axinellae]|uniref:Uncharacterized protein n=1 Tax=Fulvitalea axinellae TaxID=1182444 RepID=A0AAU9CMD6_9BACT|nr:hypothetical protein FUAX_15040 [Fulvitalea axinellae]